MRFALTATSFESASLTPFHFAAQIDRVLFSLTPLYLQRFARPEKIRQIHVPHHYADWLSDCPTHTMDRFQGFDGVLTVWQGYGVESGLEG